MRSGCSNAVSYTHLDVYKRQIDNFVLVGYILALTFLLLLIRFLWVLAMERVRNRMGDDPHRLSKADLKSALVMRCV